MFEIPLEPPADPIRSAIEAQAPEPGAMLRRVIVFTEWQDTSGACWLSGYSDCSPWEAEGIIRYAMREGLAADDDAWIGDDE